MVGRSFKVPERQIHQFSIKKSFKYELVGMFVFEYTQTSMGHGMCVEVRE